MTRESSGPELLLNEIAERTIVAASLAGLPREAGGILVGYREESRIVVTAALPVDSGNSGTHHYKQEHDDAAEALRNYRSTLHPEDISGYVGEWHSHPKPSGPSPTDRTMMRATFKKGTGNPIALIVCTPSNDDHRLYGLIFRKGKFGRVSSVPVSPQSSSTGAPLSVNLG